jgi:hypothetical protein
MPKPRPPERWEALLVLGRTGSGKTPLRRYLEKTGFQRKLEIFRARTFPLLEYYRDAGTSVVSIPVGAETRPEEILARIGSGGNG